MALKNERFKQEKKETAAKTEEKSALSKRPARFLAKPERDFTMGTLEEALLKEFPSEDAESWDRTGMTVGERGLPVKAVAVALDPTVTAIRKAAEIGANVLITHHPAFLEGPISFAPEDSLLQSPGAGVWAAIQHQVCLMDFHTSLDVSRKAQVVLPNLLGFKYKDQLISPLPTTKKKGYGQFCKVPEVSGRPDTLAHVAAKCTSVFGRVPRVWGDFQAPISTAVTATGSAGGLGQAVLGSGADCLICGEVKYHDALELSQAGLSIIELGHDVSELPLTAVLAKTLTEIGIPKESIIILDQSDNWTYPETIRI